MERKTLADQGIKIKEEVAIVEEVAAEKAVVKAPVAKAPRKRFTMVKNFGGGLAVLLESEDYSVPARKIVFGYQEEEKQIPVKWAIGTFVSDSAMKQLKLGYFTFKELDELIAMAEDMGHYVPDYVRAPEVTIRELRKIIRSGNLGELKRVFPGLSKKDKTDLVAMGQKLYNNLNMSIISYIESELKVSLTTINLDE